MVFSIGTDIVDIARIERLIKRYGERFGRRVLSLEELTDWHMSNCSPAFLAKRFAAKEAVIKALNNKNKIKFNFIEIRHYPNGKPYVILKSYPKIFLEISISHSIDLAIGYCIKR